MMCVNALGCSGVKYSAKHHYCKIITKHRSRTRILLVHFLELYLTLYQKHHRRGAIQENREMYMTIWWHKLLYSQLRNKALTRAQTPEQVWSLDSPHCVGPASRTSSGGGGPLVLLLLPDRDEEIEAFLFLPLFLFISTDFYPYFVKVLSTSQGHMLSS